MQKGLIRLCILGCVLATLLSPAAAYCSVMGKANDECHTIPGTGLLQKQCGVGGQGGVQYRKLGGLFTGQDFKHSCLVDAAVNCAAVANAQHPINPDTSCCSCYLYAKYCAGAHGLFVTNGQTPATADHSLLMPASACTGVENWDQPGCPKESIWDKGESMISGKGDLWGMAINPVSRRGQHQMHVHLAQVHKSLKDAIVEGFTQHQKTQFYVDCTGGQNTHTLDHCSYSATQCHNCPEVQIKQNHVMPSNAKPFEVVYGTNPNLIKQNVLDASTLVLRLPKTAVGNKDIWALVINPYGPAECAFEATKKSCT